MHRCPKKMSHLFVAILLTIAATAGNISAQQEIELTQESAVDLMMNNSYAVTKLKMGIEQSRYYLKAERASLKSKVYINLETPDINRTSDYKWNSTLQRNEIVRENSNRWQADLSVKQPVILFGYPTNGNLSFNYKVYRYGQSEDGEDRTDYYNRWYLRFEQPLFQPNELKNDIEEAELDLEEEELDFLSDQVEIIEDASDEYYDLFRTAYNRNIIASFINNLLEAQSIAREIVAADSARAIELRHVELELSNARNEQIGYRSELRNDLASARQALRLGEDVTLTINPLIEIYPLQIDEARALQYAFTLRPSLRLLNISKRMSEIDFEYTKANNAFRLDLEMTYGLERSEERYRNIWNDYDNSTSVTLNAYIPIWDWGQRKSRIAGAKINLDRQVVNIDERRTEIRTDVLNRIANLNESQDRALTMQNSVGIAREITAESIEQYRGGLLTLQDLLRTIQRQKETEDNYLDAYLEFRNSVLYLMLNTYYDFEEDISLIDKLRSKYSVQ